jgi:hypothetical protein
MNANIANNALCFSIVVQPSQKELWLIYSTLAAFYPIATLPNSAKHNASQRPIKALAIPCSTYQTDLSEVVRSQRQCMLIRNNTKPRVCVCSAAQLCSAACTPQKFPKPHGNQEPHKRAATRATWFIKIPSIAFFAHLGGSVRHPLASLFQRSCLGCTVQLSHKSLRKVCMPWVSLPVTLISDRFPWISPPYMYKSLFTVFSYSLHAAV